MPSWDIHRKYGKMLGINEEIQKRVDEFIDRHDHHDFFDYFTEKTKVGTLGTIRILSYYFDSASFLRSEMYREIEKYGDEGFKCYFLHIFLDIIERNTRYKRNPDIIMFEDYHGLLRHYVEEIGKFVEENYEQILEDIRRYRNRKGQKIGRTAGMIKGTLKNAILATLFRGMTGTVYSHGPKMTYYRKIIKDHGIDHFLSELKYHGDYSIFIANLRENFSKFCDEIVFPEIMDIVNKYTVDEIISNEELLKEFLKRLFKAKL